MNQAPRFEPSGSAPASSEAIDFERRFGGLRRLYGVAGSQRIFNAHVAVVGIGGVGSWVAESLARSGVRRLTLIDLDHVSESNINRQIHAVDTTLGQSKVLAMRDRIAQFNPVCQVDVIDEFVTHDNWGSCLSAIGWDRDFCEPSRGGVASPRALIDACDQVRAKTTMASWALTSRTPFVSVGAAGGKRQAHAVELADLSDATHDPLLAQLRYRLRKEHAAERNGHMGVACIFSREAVAPPDPSCALDAADGSLNCHGYGSTVSVTATFGLCAAGAILDALAKGLPVRTPKKSPTKIPRVRKTSKNDAII